MSWDGNSHFDGPKFGTDIKERTEAEVVVVSLKILKRKIDICGIPGQSYIASIHPPLCDLFIDVNRSMRFSPVDFKHGVWIQ